KKTSLGKKLEQKIKDWVPTIGNQGSVEVTELSLDTDTRKLKASVKVKAEHGGRVLGKEGSVGVEQTRAITYDIDTGDVEGALEYPLGKKSIRVAGREFGYDFGEVNISSKMIKSIIDGDLEAALEEIPNLGVVKKEYRREYELIKKETLETYGADNVYF